MREQKPSWVSKLHGYSPATLDCIERNGDVEGAFIIGGTSSGGQVGWLARGSALEVFTLSTGARIAAWCFGAILKDSATRVTVVTECCYDNCMKLLVATTTPNTNSGTLCVFDVNTSKVVRAVDVPYKITCMEVVTSVGSQQAPAHILSDHLRHFCGIVAVGTHCGHIYLLDLCLDDEESLSDEVSPCGLVHLELHARDIASKRYNALSKGRHLCLELGEEAHNRGYYEFRKPDNSIIRTYSADNVYISSLMFTPQTGLLFVGFSFGCFQLWRLHIPVLEYSSKFEEDLYPVTRFAYQEPENDPRKFSYVWVARGPDAADDIGYGTSTISLFQLGFNRRNWYEEFGYLFEDLVSVGLRFEHELTASPFNPGEASDGGGSRVIGCFTVKDPRYKVPSRVGQDDSFDEAVGQDLGLCAVVWEAETPEAHARNLCFLALFDMNRWYHTQMPPSLRSSSYRSEVCPYFAFYALEEVLEVCNPDSILALYLDHSSICKFSSSMIPAPEQHFYPSSLALGGTCVAETGVVRMRCLGIQRQILADVQGQGPMSLVDPTDLYHLCLYAGLLPRSFEHSTASGASAMHRRDAILSAALDHHLVGFITACISQWAVGEYASVGCTLKALLDWAWKKVASIKTSLDRSCESLYDWSGMQFDEQTLQSLHHQQVALSHMVTIFQALATQVVPTTEQGRQDLATKVHVVSLLNQHLQTVLWFYAKDFLPECPEQLTLEKAFPYPAQALAQAYSKRRKEIQKLNSNLKPTDVLLIDGILENSGAAIKTLWEKEGGLGFFPPPSLYATLNIHLLETVPLTTKNTVILYLLCELLASAPEDKQPEMNLKLQHFCQAFSVPPSTSKFVQGIWLLDHREFEDSLNYLLDPSVQSEVSAWQHTRIIKAFIYQGRSKLALKYLRIKRPPMLTREDVKLRLTVLLANGLISEAFEFQRICRDQLSSQDLLSHLFLGCQQTKTMDQLLQLPFSEEEERHLVDFLRKSPEPQVKELLVLYYLQRARFTEAIRLNTQLQESSHTLDIAMQDRVTIRNCIVEGYRRVMPAVQRKLAAAPERSAPSRHRVRKEVDRPVPLSAFVNKSTHKQTITRASLIQAVMERVQEVKVETSDLEPEMVTDGDPQSPSQARHKEPQQAPFISTPLTPRVKRRCSDTREVVFPSTREHLSPADRLGISKMTTSPMAASPIKSPYNVPSPFKLNASSFAQSFLQGRRKSLRFQSAEALSLLQTPPVKRRTPSQRSRLTRDIPDTPQSILKSRHRQNLARPSLSVPAMFKPDCDSSAASTPKALQISIQPVPPSEPTDTDSLPETPKKLRFSEPFPDTPTPEKEAENEEFKEILATEKSSSVTVDIKVGRAARVQINADNEMDVSQESEEEEESEKEVYDDLDIEEEAAAEPSKLEFETVRRNLSRVPEESEVVVLDDDDDDDEEGEERVDTQEDEEVEEEEEAMLTDEVKERTENEAGDAEHYTEKISRWQQILQDCDICREFEQRKTCVHINRKPVDRESEDREEIENKVEIEEEQEDEEDIQQETESESSQTENESETVKEKVEQFDEKQNESELKSDRRDLGRRKIEVVFGSTSETVTSTTKETETESGMQENETETESETPVESEACEDIPVSLQLELSPEKGRLEAEKVGEKTENVESAEQDDSLQEEDSFEIVFNKTDSVPTDTKSSQQFYTQAEPITDKAGVKEQMAMDDSEVVTPPVTRRVTRSSSMKKEMRPSVVKRRPKAGSISENQDDSETSPPRHSKSDTVVKSPGRKGSTSQQTDASNEQKSTGAPKSPGRRGRPRKTDLNKTETAHEPESEEEDDGGGVPKSPSRRGPSRRSDIHQTPTRQSVRILARELHKSESEDNESPTRKPSSEASTTSSKATKPKKTAAEKTTPPKPARVSVLPPTPPKSTTPESVSSRDVAMETHNLRVTRSQSRSRSNSPVEGMEVKVKSPSRRSTRRTSSVSSSVTEETTTVKRGKGRPRKGSRSSVSPSGGESERGETSATDNTDAESVASEHHGPLSRGSFMNKLRSGRRSREITPEPQRVSEPDTEEEADNPNFTFSMPLAVEFNNGEDAGSRPGTPPVHSFIFSPPLTRSARSRRESLASRKSLPGIALFPGTEDTSGLSPAKVAKKAPEKKTMKKPKRKSIAVVDSPDSVLLLSPVPEEDVDSNTTRRQPPLTRERLLKKKLIPAKPKTRKLRNFYS